MHLWKEELGRVKIDGNRRTMLKQADCREKHDWMDVGTTCMSILRMFVCYCITILYM